MICFAPSEKDVSNTTLEKKPWYRADQFRANSDLKAQARELEAMIAANVAEILET